MTARTNSGAAEDILWEAETAATNTQKPESLRVLCFRVLWLACSARLAPTRSAAAAQRRPVLRNGQSIAPIDVTGYWVSMIVDEWRSGCRRRRGTFVLPLNAEARRVANAWDPAKDDTDGKACKAYGAVGVMQRPGRLHITWENSNTLKIDADAGTQTRVIHFGQTPAEPGAPSWQGSSIGNWQVNGRLLLDTGGAGFVPAGRQSSTSTSGSMKVVTTNMLPGYIRKNGVPYSEKAVLTEYFNRLTGQQNDAYLSVTAMVDDPTYLRSRSSDARSKTADAAGWDRPVLDQDRAVARGSQGQVPTSGPSDPVGWWARRGRGSSGWCSLSHPAHRLPAAQAPPSLFFKIPSAFCRAVRS